MLAMGRAGRHTYGIAVRDGTVVHVSGLDGAEIERHLVACVARSHVPFVVCTSSADLAQRIGTTVPDAALIDLDAHPTRGRWKPARHHHQLPKRA